MFYVGNTVVCYQIKPPPFSISPWIAAFFNISKVFEIPVCGLRENYFNDIVAKQGPLYIYMSNVLLFVKFFIQTYI